MPFSEKEYTDSGLLVFPRQLVFGLLLHRDSSTSLRMKNLTQKRQAFKVFTTSPSRYSVIPCNGFILPQETTILTVTMRRFRHVPNRLGCCIDKFLIKGIQVDDSVLSVTSMLFEDKRKVSKDKVEAWIDELYGTETFTDFSPKQSEKSFPFMNDARQLERIAMYKEKDTYDSSESVGEYTTRKTSMFGDVKDVSTIAESPVAYIKCEDSTLNNIKQGMNTLAARVENLEVHQNMISVSKQHSHSTGIDKVKTWRRKDRGLRWNVIISGSVGLNFVICVLYLKRLCRVMHSILVVILVALTGTVLSSSPPPELLTNVQFQSAADTRHLLDNNKLAQLRLWTALNNGDLDEMKKALDDGADANIKTERSGFRPLHLAASIGNVAAVKLLIEHGAEVDARTSNGTAALHYSAHIGDIKVTKVLLEHKADPDIQDNRKFAPLHYASYAPPNSKTKGQPFKTAEYFEMSREIDVVASQTSEAMSKQTSPGNGQFQAVVNELISSNADVNILTVSNETPLHYTPAFDRYQITQDLIKAGADVNKQDIEKETPLHEAVAYGAFGVTQVLLINGADTTIKEQTGLTPDEFICKCRTYKDDNALTQCAPGKCLGEYDRLVIERIFDVAAQRH
eukprot:g1891.t1